MALDAGADLEIWTRDDFYGSCAASSRTNKVFVAYLAYDLTNTLFWNRRWSGWVSNTIHHAMGIVCWVTIETRGVAHVLGVTAVMTELTTPFINLRWFLHETGLKESRLYIANGLLMTALWFVVRILLFGWLGLRLHAMRADLFAIPRWQTGVLLGSFATGFALQVFWFRKIAKGAFKVLFGKKKRA